MHNSLVEVSSNWYHIGGCAFVHSVQERAADPDFFSRPKLNELIDAEKSILLSKEKSSEYCELNLKLLANYKIQAISFVCNVVKVEVFQGHIKEYLQTIYGVIVDEPDDLFKSYRYDVEVEKSGITDLTLRFLTDSSDICIFGIILHTAPNPNGITTLLSNVTAEDTISDKYEKMLKLVTGSNQHKLLNHDLKEKVNIDGEQFSTTMTKINADALAGLKSYIDGRFQEMENCLKIYLEDMEKRQNQKLDTILNILEKINK